MMRVKWRGWWLRLLQSVAGTERDSRVLDKSQRVVYSVIDGNKYSPTIPLASSLSVDEL